MLHRSNVTFLTSNLAAAACDTSDRVLLALPRHDSVGKESSNIGMVVGISVAILLSLILIGFLIECSEDSSIEFPCL